MQTRITARNIEITEGLRVHIEEKISKIKKYLDQVSDLHLVLSVEKYRHFAEITFNVNGLVLHAEEETGDMYSSIDKVVNKVEQRVKKHKEKINSAKTQDKNIFFPESEETEISSRKEKGSLNSFGRIVKIRKISLKPISTEEAIIRMNSSANDFLVFFNARNEKINVIYRCRDGNYGLVEPD